MNVFKGNNQLNTFRFPAVKMVLSLLVIFLCITRNYVIQINNGIINIVVTVACFLLTVMCVLVIYISFAEIINVVDNRRLLKMKSRDVNNIRTKDYTTGAIIEMIEKSDIIDILIKSCGRIVNIGSSSNCKNSDSIFFDKQYYIDKSTYANVDEFRNALASINDNDETISVISIDGIT